MVKKILVAAVILFITQSSYGQKRWTVGTYFIPSYMFFDTAPQDVNINLLSGIAAGKDVSLRTSINANILYFKSNQTYISNCNGICPIIKEELKNKFIELSLGVRVDLSPFKPSTIKPYAIIGISGNFDFDSYTTFYHSSGNVNINYRRGFQYNYIYGYAGVSLEYSFSNQMKLVIDPMVRFPVGLLWFSQNIISYTALVGIGIGVNIKI